MGAPGVGAAAGVSDPENAAKLLANLAELNADRMRLRQLERRLRALLGYYDPEDLAAHVAAAVDGGPTYHPDGVVRPVWINHKLVDAIRELRRELFPDEPERTA